MKLKKITATSDDEAWNLREEVDENSQKTGHSILRKGDGSYGDTISNPVESDLDGRSYSESNESCSSRRG